MATKFAQDSISTKVTISNETGELVCYLEELQRFVKGIDAGAEIRNRLRSLLSEMGVGDDTRERELDDATRYVGNILGWEMKNARER